MATLALFLGSHAVYATNELNESILVEYLKLQKEFYAEACPAKTEANYQNLDKNYRGEGNFVPFTLDEKIDQKTIKNIMPLMKEKSIWIQEQIDFIQKTKNFRSLRLDIEHLEEMVAHIQEARKTYYFTKSKLKKTDILNNVSKQFNELLIEVEKFKDQIPFLLSFKFPINHLTLRGEYEKFRNGPTKEERSRANSIYLFRKIVQDGSYDADLIKNDSVIRSAFDTLYLSLTKTRHRNFLTDNERVDFNFILKNFDKYLSLKPEILKDRLEEWKARNERAILFYQDLTDGQKNKSVDNGRIVDVNAYVLERARSLYALKDFVYNREAFAYEYWSKKSELLQSLYVIETILYSEVGQMDAPDALERKDVAQVIINRSTHSSYNYLSPKDPLYKHLSPSLKVSDNKWLNVLFKEGEFSFTYFYIPGNFNIYCPDMSKTGQFLRKENVRIALNLLNKPREDFKALRYFSRLSMFGRIEMDSLWEEFRALPEVPGNPVKNPKKMYQQFKKDRYKLLYDFNNDDLKKSFMVIELKGKTYVVSATNFKQIYYYRNPHQFKYFTLLK
jgi:hypothetical protein